MVDTRIALGDECPTAAALLTFRSGRWFLLFLDYKPMIWNAGVSPQNDDFNIPVNSRVVETRHEVLGRLRLVFPERETV